MTGEPKDSLRNSNVDGSRIAGGLPMKCNVQSALYRGNPFDIVNVPPHTVLV